MTKTLVLPAMTAGFLPGVAAAGPHDQVCGRFGSGDRLHMRRQETVAISHTDGAAARDPRQPATR